MDRGIYAASSGGLLNARRLEIVSNNMANVSTVGFKAERLVSRQQEFADTLASTLPNAPNRAKSDAIQTPGVVDLTTKTDFTPGPVANTGNPLDVALGEPNTFFVVQTPEGETYTRAGNFTLNGQGTLVTKDGMPVLSDGGQLQLPPGDVRISGNGTVIANGEDVGRLRVVQVDDLTQLKRVEGTRFSLEGQAKPRTVDQPSLINNSVEMANVSVVEAMIDMISTQKGFEAYTKTTRTIDELNDRAIRNTRIEG